MKKYLIAALAMIAPAFVTPASAADLPVYKAVQAFNWTGFYVGAHVGYGWIHSNDGGPDADGILGGIQAGYNWQLNRNWVFGIESDFAGTDIKNAVPSHMDYVGTARVRLGYTMDRVMVYGTGGFAFVRVGAQGAPHAGETGYAAGAGIEWMFAPRWSLKTEYMHVGFSQGPFDTRVDTLKLGVNYHF